MSCLIDVLHLAKLGLLDESDGMITESGLKAIVPQPLSVSIPCSWIF